MDWMGRGGLGLVLETGLAGSGTSLLGLLGSGSGRGAGRGHLQLWLVEEELGLLPLGAWIFAMVCCANCLVEGGVGGRKWQTDFHRRETLERRGDGHGGADHFWTPSVAPTPADECEVGGHQGVWAGLARWGGVFSACLCPVGKRTVRYAGLPPVTGQSQAVVAVSR